MLKDKQYGKIAHNQRLYSLIEVLDAKSTIRILDINDNELFCGNVYKIYDNKEIKQYEEYIIEYISFSIIGTNTVVVIKNDEIEVDLSHEK